MAECRLVEYLVNMLLHLQLFLSNCCGFQRMYSFKDTVKELAKKKNNHIYPEVASPRLNNKERQDKGDSKPRQGEKSQTGFSHKSVITRKGQRNVAGQTRKSLREAKYQPYYLYIRQAKKKKKILSRSLMT